MRKQRPCRAWSYREVICYQIVVSTKPSAHAWLTTPFFPMGGQNSLAKGERADFNETGYEEAGAVVRTRSTALLHPAYSASRWLRAIRGSNTRSLLRAAARAARSFQSPTPRPARNAAPVAVVSTTAGRFTGTPRMSA